MRFPVVIEPGQGEQIGSVKGRGDEGVQGVPRFGQKAPGHEHGPAG